MSVNVYSHTAFSNERSQCPTEFPICIEMPIQRKEAF